ncbi:hypothetical protein ACJX0J_019345, partial [Zea mays]
HLCGPCIIINFASGPFKALRENIYRKLISREMNVNTWQKLFFKKHIYSYMLLIAIYKKSKLLNPFNLNMDRRWFDAMTKTSIDTMNQLTTTRYVANNTAHQIKFEYISIIITSLDRSMANVTVFEDI